MFEAVRKNKRISQVILAIIIVPFAFFGMDAYFSESPGGGEVASVGGSKITVVDFDRALREQQDRLREATGGQFDRALFESEAFRRSVLNGLINQRLLSMHAIDNRMVVTSSQLQETILSLPAFQEDGRFSLERYERALRAQGMSPAMFEASLAQDMRVQQIAQAVGETAFTGSAPVRRFVQAQLEEREIRDIPIPVQRFITEARLEDGAARAFYEANPAQFERAPRLRAEYLVLDEAAVRAGLSIPDEQIEQFYAANQDQFGMPEERRARHILIQVGADATAAEVEQARARAEAIVAKLRDDPARFEALARSESQDPGSAAVGGDLGFFGRGMMVAPFEDTVFGQQVGEISNPVRTDFGFHIIEVTAINPDTIRPLAEVREEIVAELVRQEVARQFGLLAEQFANTVYEQPDSLQPAAELMGLEIRATDWIDRDSGSVGGFRDERLLNALFSADAHEGRENIEAIEVDRGTLLSARVVEYEDAQRLAFEEVRETIEEQLRAQEAARLTREHGEALLARVSAGEAPDEEWSTIRRVQRANPTLPGVAMQAVFGVAADALPAHVGVAMPDGGYALYRVESVDRPELADDDARLAPMVGQYERLMAQKDFNAFLASLRDRYPVEIRATALRTE
ncbi:SurA N-terminal domain-containing protein [Rhodocyclaceae bacterium SMB388]